MESLLAQVRHLDPSLRAWATIVEERALESAHQAEREMSGPGGPRSTLHGIPVGIKDNYYTAAMRTTMGSPLFDKFVPEYDATSVALLKQAGAVVMGKTVTTQFASLEPAETCNPWNLEHTPGGSSSGSGAAVAARMCPAALGTQTGGSVIRPAAYNGVVGLKPTHGLISLFGIFPVSWSLDTPGILARSVEDVAIVLQVLAAHDQYDQESLDTGMHDYPGASLRLDCMPRIGLLKTFFLERAALEVVREVERAGEELAGAGASVEEASLPLNFDAALEAQAVLQGVESAVVHRDMYAKHRELYGRKVQEQIEGGLKASAVSYAMAKQLQSVFAANVGESLMPFDVLLVPATEVPAPSGLHGTGDPLFQRAWTYAGVPVITLPIGLSKDGMPVGVQLIGRKLDEGRLLAVARWCERVFAFAEIPSIAR
jgi:aspartyl-tRNA(Asn)/glutamyl-tRNA(Gln) amidotransferase subunit A